MAYGRRRFRRRLRRRGFRAGRRSYKRKFTSKHRSGRYPRVELKYYEAGEAGLAPEIILNIGINRNFATLNNIAEGSAVNQRTGRKMNMKSVLIKGHFINPSYIVPTAVVSAKFRCALVYDAQPNGNYPSTTDLFATLQRDGTLAHTVESGVNLNNRERFLVLREKEWVLWFDHTALTEVTAAKAIDVKSPSIFPIKWFVNLRGLETTFSASATNANSLGSGGITTGALLFVWIGCYYDGAGQAATPGQNLIFRLQSRLRYYD